MRVTTGRRGRAGSYLRLGDRDRVGTAVGEFDRRSTRQMLSSFPPSFKTATSSNRQLNVTYTHGFVCMVRSKLAQGILDLRGPAAVSLRATSDTRLSFCFSFYRRERRFFAKVSPVRLRVIQNQNETSDGRWPS